MTLLANQISSPSISANQKADFEHQFENECFNVNALVCWYAVWTIYLALAFAKKEFH